VRGSLIGSQGVTHAGDDNMGFVAGGERHREVLRQQFNFSPNGAREAVEEYALQLEDVSTIQLQIVPSIDGRPAVARVSELRVASV
jgi:hypothetical protein